MHPILGSARRRTLYLASWTVIGLLVAVAWSAANPGAGIVVALAVVVPPCLVQGFVCLSAWYVCRAAPLGARSMVRALAMHTGAGVVAAAVWVTVWAGWTGVLDGLLAFSRLPAVGGAPGGASGAQLVAVFGAGVLLFWLSSLLHYLLAAFEESRGAEARELGLAVLAREAELRALRAQIDPHFLFNGLQSISALTATDPDGARRMCLLLADFFRRSVRLGAEDEIPLDEELAMVRAYLEIETVRYGSRLESDVVLDSGCGACRVPPLILQPLVENAVRHGIRPLVEGGTVRVAARCDASSVHLRVRNPVDPDAATPRGTGVGLANVERRLATRFGREAVVRWRRKEGRFEVELRFPRIDAPARAPGAADTAGTAGTAGAPGAADDAVRLADDADRRIGRRRVAGVEEVRYGGLHRRGSAR